MKNFDINELYDIVQRLKTYNDEFKTAHAILSKNKSASMHRRESEALIGLQNTLAEFEVFIDKIR